MDQFIIAVTGLVAIWLTQEREAGRRRWACWFGLLGQPFWFYATWQAQQWGMFVLSIFFTLAWFRGVWNLWVFPMIGADRA